MMTPEQRLRQSKVKMRIIGAREMREWLAGERSFLPACGMERIALDAVQSAYAAGSRLGATEASKNVTKLRKGKE